MLIDKGAKVNDLNKDETALYAAAINGHLETCKTLLSMNADVKFEKYNGYTLLCAAAEKGHPELCTQFIMEGCKVNHVTR